MLRLMIVGTSIVALAAAGGCGGSLTPDPGNTIDGGTCTLGTDAPQLWARGVDPQGLSFDYDGPAFVATSTADSLTLSISVPPDAGTGTDGGAGTTSVEVTGMMPMPPFPIGARVWLTKSKDGMPWFGPPPPSSFAVRDGQGGPLLFGGAIGSYGPLSFPVQVDPLLPACSKRDQGCAPNSTITYASGIVTGDQPALIGSDQLGTILLGGGLYEVRLFAANEPVVQPVSCTDFFGISEVQVDVRATDLASLIAGLPTPVLLDAPRAR